MGQTKLLFNQDDVKLVWRFGAKLCAILPQTDITPVVDTHAKVPDCDNAKQSSAMQDP